jgi:hypothetical protein
VNLDAERFSDLLSLFDRVIDPALPGSTFVDEDELRVVKADPDDDGIGTFAGALDELLG